MTIKIRFVTRSIVTLFTMINFLRFFAFFHSILWKHKKRLNPFAKYIKKNSFEGRKNRIIYLFSYILLNNTDLCKKTITKKYSDFHSGHFINVQNPKCLPTFNSKNMSSFFLVPFFQWI
jgi:hypothetical protein